MRPIPFSELIAWVRGEYRNHGSVFGIRREKFFRPTGNSNTTSSNNTTDNSNSTNGNSISVFGTKISSPIGPAAGPNSQLAQNILVSCLAGARFIELKTVQIMDGEELRKAVARPCINTVDEGYNVEWSTELTVSEAFGEYVKAWFLCHVFAKEFGIADAGSLIFNMSAGYSLDGIKSEKIDAYIEGMKDARNTAIWKSCYQYLSDNIASFEKFTKKDLDAVTPEVSSCITLSTLHGCPREEIEKIAAYLIREKGLHTYIKCNPTLLGYETARRLLDEMGYSYISFDDHHFKDDLQFNDAVEMLRRLMKTAKERNLCFGVKITNTFPVDIKQNELPGSEMYMSGRALFPLSINVADKLSRVFNGELPISYSGGADNFNLAGILKTGIRPVTMATTILKPGGYERLTQLAELAAKTLTAAGSNAVDGSNTAVGNNAAANSNTINVKALTALAEGLTGMKRYRKEYRQTSSRKTSSALPLFDCAKAPCMDGGCPLHQKIPAYLAEAAAGNFRRAFDIIAIDNTAPSITGTICDHQCQHKCTRVDYDDPLNIRKAKLFASENAQEAYTSAVTPRPLKTEKTVAVIGAGPAGIAAALLLRRNGVPVKVREKRDRPYGVVRHVIPAFRISDEAIYRDYAMAEKNGVEFVYNAGETYSVKELKKSNSFIVIATGAWKEGAAVVKQGGEKIIDALKFLEASKKSNCGLDLGKRVAVIGGGDVAMDCARAAKKNRGVESVSVVYRRTREFMPAQYAEQEEALRDGVEFLELLAPEAFTDGVLSCEVTRLSDYDESGRRGIRGTGEKREFAFDAVIGAVGARVDTAPFTQNGIALNASGEARGFPVVNGACESSVSGVYVAGDCKAGAATVVKAIADGKAVAADILAKLGLPADFSCAPEKPPCTANDSNSVASLPDLYLKKGVIVEAHRDHTDGFRCLSCDTLCELCVDVCPNRANVMIEMEDGSHEVVHIDRICNECGNCASFCPHAGRPYRDKFTVFGSAEDFKDSENPGFLKTGADTYTLRLENKSVLNCRKGDAVIPAAYSAMINRITVNYSYLTCEVTPCC
jgi:putative selenate reductase